MKKQNKQREAEPKQNTTPSVSDETKQRLVQQYRDRADASSKQNDINPPEWDGEWNYSHSGMVHPWESYDLPKNGMDVDGFVSEKHIDPTLLATGEHSYGLGEAQNTPFWNGASDGTGYQSSNYAPAEAINMDQLNNIVNAISNDAMANRADTNLKPNMLYGYGDAPLDVVSRYETPADRPEGYRTLYDYLEGEGLEDWADDTNIVNGSENQRALATAFQLMQNANDYDRQRNLEQMTQQYRDRDLYGDALMELMAQRQNPQNDRSLPNEAIQQIRDQEILENRPSPRRRNITGSAVW